MRRFAPLLFLFATSLLAAAPSRDELLKNPKYSDAGAPQFESFTADSLPAAVKVSSRRSYAVIGFNAPSITVWLPPASNSIYSSAKFDLPRLTDSHGHDVSFGVDEGIFDFDTSSNEIRFTQPSRTGVLDFAHAVGTITVKYPLVMRSISYRKSDSNLKIDGPFVEYNTGQVKLPEAATFSKLLPLRAYDAKGRQLEQNEFEKLSLKGEASWRQLAFQGSVAEVQVDHVDTWGTLTINYDVAAPPRLPKSKTGLSPSPEEMLKAAASAKGKVTMTMAVEQASISIPAAAQTSRKAKGISAEDAKAKLAAENIDVTGEMLVMKSVQGNIDDVKLLIAAGAPLDARSVGQTALIAAIRGDHKELAQVLIDAGADVQARDDNNCGPLLFAAEKCDWTGIVRSLMKHGARNGPKSKGGYDALQFAQMQHCDDNEQLISGN